jgi:DNA-directed RNA polymerase III subunit RPC3
MTALLWRFNPAAVLRVMRHEALVQYTREKLSARAAQVVAIMLLHGNAHERGCNSDSGPEVSAQDLHAALRAEAHQRAADQSPLSAAMLSKIGAENLTWEQLLKVLGVLQNACGGIVQRVSSGADGGRWSVQMGAIVDDLREASLMDLLVQQQGLEAARIVRLLVQRGSLTDQMVADAALLDVKVARNKLYSLFALGVLGQQALPKFSNHMPQHTIYLWKADWEALQRSSTNLVYRILVNLRVRRHKEAKRYERLSAAGRSAADPVAHTAALAAVVAAVDKLDAAVLHLDKTLMLLTSW